MDNENNNQENGQVNKFDRSVDQTYNRDESRVDPFDVETLVRVCFGLEDGQETPDGINITYNDLIDYNTYLIKMAFDSYDRGIAELQNKQRGRTDE
jgi:hypothetical protein